MEAILLSHLSTFCFRSGARAEARQLYSQTIVCLTWATILGEMMKLAYVSSASDFMLEDTTASLIALIASKITLGPPVPRYV